MSRPSEEERVRAAVADYLAKAERGTAKDLPITISAINRATGISRTTLTKYGFSAPLRAAQERQGRSGATVAATAEEDAYGERLDALRNENMILAAQNQALVRRMQIIEGNIGRLGLDPEELYRPLVKPPRSRPRTSGRPSPNGLRGERRR